MKFPLKTNFNRSHSAAETMQSHDRTNILWPGNNRNADVGQHTTDPAPVNKGLISRHACWMDNSVGMDMWHLLNATLLMLDKVQIEHNVTVVGWPAALGWWWYLFLIWGICLGLKSSIPWHLIDWNGKLWAVIVAWCYRSLQYTWISNIFNLWFCFVCLNTWGIIEKMYF